MSRLELRPFSEEFVGAAGELLAARHRRHRAAEPLLPPRFEEPGAAAELVAELARGEGASGAVALRGGRVVGYLLGGRKSDETWGPNVWVELAGHAVEEAEDLRDLYALAAARWVEEDGRPRHYALAPATDAEVLRAWYRLGFGHQHAYAIQAVPPGTEWPEGVRTATPEDVEAILDLDPLLPDHQARSPVFAGGPPRQSRDEQRADVLEDLAKDEIGDIVVERDGRVVGSFQLVPVELSSSHAGLARPEGAAFLGWGATEPAVRGSGAGLALMEGAFAWARERGHDVIVVDWRETNLLASRFWPARGFRTTFLRLYRHIP
jgi:ribosomal protein S18 acetylase RimI-like enzyme